MRAWRGQRVPHVFHAECVARLPAMTRALAHARQHGDNGPLFEVQCPLCNTPWGDNRRGTETAHDLVGRLTAQGFDFPDRGCRCARCEALGLGATEADNHWRA